MQLQIGTVPLTGEVPDESVCDFKGAPVSALQESPAIGAAGVVFFPRGNRKSTVTFTINRTHASAEAAADFLIRHESQFPVQGLFTYKTDVGELYLAAAVADVTSYTFLGASTTHAYRVVGGAWLTTLPQTA